MVIREVIEKDAERYLNMLRSLDEQTKFMMFEPGERKTSVEDQERIIRNNRNSGNPMFLVEIDEEIIGFLGGLRGKCNRAKHSLYIALGILKAYRGKGIGKLLMKKVDEWSIENEIKRVELTVICNNERAVNLYKSYGFELEGIKRYSLMVDGEFVDEYYMGKIIK